MSSAKYTLLVSQQPQPAVMVPRSTSSFASEKASRCCQNHGCCSNDEPGVEHHKCHSSRLRRIILPTALAMLLLITALVALSSSKGSLSDWDWNEVLPRATGSTSSPFVENKLYLVVLLVGLLVVIGLGIALSFWCCRGSFQNPLCCPCYLCACCGGLACLECIGCGLCAEAAEQM